MFKVNKIFFIPLFFAIIFLTGCATKGYYNKKITSSGLAEIGTGIFKNFLWPLRGEIVTSFGSQEDLVPAKGITIESRSASEVHAAQEGRVVLVDQNLKGYGKTVILEHADGFSTVYAKNSELLVSVGQEVRQGELIARAGKKSGSAFFRLYFELRKNLKAQDPLPYFKNF